MRISPPRKSFLRIGVLVMIAVLSYWVCSSRVETARNFIQNSDRPPMFVLQVGIGKYVNAPVWAELRGAVTDVVEMRKVLEGERYGIPSANIVTLTDAGGTKQQIFEKFRTHLIANAQKHFAKVNDRRKGAVVLFQFSGHGSQAPDTDGDEKDDGKDETLVTYDSHDAPGKNFDITDDEIYALTGELRQWTDNIVYILDSCHSGSGTRDSQDVRRLPERKNPVVAVAGVGTTTRSGEKKAEDGSSRVLPPGDDYIVITAARANELASQKNCFEECGDARRPVVYGNLTFYLIDELKKARSDTSYRELMENVTRRVVNEKPTQTPQIEGDKSRFVFGSLGRTEDYFIPIIEGETKKPNGSRAVKIRAGAMQGVTVGAIVSFYDKADPLFDRVEPIASGVVAGVTPADSTVTVVRQKREITINDKSVVVAPDIGSLRLKANLDADAAKLSTAQRDVVTAVRNFFSEANVRATRGVDIADRAARDSGNWDAALLRDKFSNVAARMGGDFTGCEVAGKEKIEQAEVTSPDTDVFYVAGKDYIPIFRFCLEAGFSSKEQENVAATRLKDALVHFAAHKSVNAIINKRSPLEGKIIVRPIRLSGPFECKNGNFVVGQEAATVDPKSGMYLFARREPVWFEVINTSSHDLYLTLFNLAPDGAIEIFSPREDHADERAGVLVKKNGGKRILPGDDCRLNADGSLAEAGAIRASRLGGIDRFKLIASVEPTTRDSFIHLQVSAFTRSGRGSLAAMSDWTTVETIFQINDTGN